MINRTDQAMYEANHSGKNKAILSVPKESDGGNDQIKPFSQPARRGLIKKERMAICIHSNSVARDNLNRQRCSFCLSHCFCNQNDCHEFFYTPKSNQTLADKHLVASPCTHPHCRPNAQSASIPMAISPAGATSSTSTSQVKSIHLLENSTDKQSSTEQLSATETRSQRMKQHNLDILEANRAASLSTPDEPLSLLYQTAIDAINRELSPVMGDNAVQRAQEDALDYSPEATAERIVSLSMGSFGRFQELHPEMDESEQADRFMELISSGIEEGFTAAKEILEGLSVLEGSIAEDISTTYDLVQKGLEQYRQLLANGDESQGLSIEP